MRCMQHRKQSKQNRAQVWDSSEQGYRAGASGWEPHQMGAKAAGRDAGQPTWRTGGRAGVSRSRGREPLAIPTSPRAAGLL